MIHSVCRPIAADRSEVLALLQDPGRWACWLDGVDVVAEPTGVRLEVGGPRPFAVFLSVQSCDGGVAFELVEGEISGLDGRVVLEVREGVEMVCWEQELQVPIPLPPPLAREIEDEVIGRWLARLDQVARGERDG